MFSTRLERLRQFNRLAVLVAGTLLAVGTALIAVWAVRAYNMLGAAEVDRAPIIIGVLIALAVLVVLCLIVVARVAAPLSVAVELNVQMQDAIAHVTGELQHRHDQPGGDD